MNNDGPAGTGSRFAEWTVKALLAAGAVFGLSMIMLGLPAAVFVDMVVGLGLAPKLAPGAGWPLAILITIAGSLAVVSSSIVLRCIRPDIAGWKHVGWTALLALAATFVFTIAVMRA